MRCMDRIVVGPRRRPDVGISVLGSGWIAAVHLQLGDDLFVDSFGLAVALGSVGHGELVADPLEGLQLPDEIIVDPGVTVQDDDSGATMDAEEVVVEGVGKLGLSH
jgi:H2-forming N5,N10-methylenetetrahydromethanopterin dehydrogenase-like enzyme